MSLTKSRTVLALCENWPDMPVVIFDDLSPADRRPPAVTLDRADWLDFGKPEFITVTVEPGDQLNV